MSVLKSISYFIAINIAAGVLNYLFQVVGARSLSIEDFSKFNKWYAYTTMFALTGGLLQNAANFYLIPHKQIIRQNVIFVVLAIIGLGLVLSERSESTRLFTGIFILFATMNGWLTGQSQVRLMYQTMAFAGLTIAAVKVGLAGFQIWPSTTETYIKIITLAFVPSIALLSYRLFKSEKNLNIQVRHTSREVISAAIAISVATALVPQIDILILSKTLNKNTFEAFIQASIFYKVVFFFFLIVAQWLLPQQTLDQGLSIIRKLYTFAPLALGLAAASILTLISEPVSVNIMNWHPAPPRSYVFFSCINMSLLTWLFLLIQEACAKRKAHVALGSVVGLILLGVFQYLTGWSIHIYFAINGAVTFFLILILLHFLKKTSSSVTSS